MPLPVSRRLLTLLVGLVVLASTCLPGDAASAAPRLSLVDLSTKVTGARVTVHTTVRASRAARARHFGVCMRDSAGRNVDFWKRPGTISSRGTRSVPDTKTLAPGRYRVFACVSLAGRWTNLGGETVTIRPVGTPTPAAPRGVRGSWRLDFADEFDGTQLDPRWSTGWFGAGVTQPVNPYEDQCYAPSQVRLPGNGRLTLALRAEPTWCGGRERGHLSGLVSTRGRYTFRHGAVESRVFLPADRSGRILNWPAFWTNGEQWPDDGENDVMEAIGGRLGSHYHSAAGDAGFWLDGARGGWHTFTAVWEPGRLTWYYDGLRVGQVREGVVDAPHHLVLNQAAARGGVTVPADLVVDYVRVWRR